MSFITQITPIFLVCFVIAILYPAYANFYIFVKDVVKQIVKPKLKRVVKPKFIVYLQLPKMINKFDFIMKID